MIKTIPEQLDNEKNQMILKHLAPLSCHSDIVLPLEKCLTHLKDVSSFCPDNENFRYVIWFVEDTIFAFAAEMQEVSLFLGIDNTTKYDAYKCKHQTLPQGWFSFPYNSPELYTLAETAYNYAKNS